MNPINSVGGNSPVQKTNLTPVKKDLPVDAPAKPSLRDRVERPARSPRAGRQSGCRKWRGRWAPRISAA